MRRRSVVGLLVLLPSSMLVGASPGTASAQSRAAPAAPDTVALPAELDVVLRNYERAWGDRDAVALADLFTPDGFVLRPGFPAAKGREAILEAYANAGGPLSLRAYGYAVDGDVGYIVGGYGPGPDLPAGGKFVLALRRDVDGRWLIAADMDNH